MNEKINVTQEIVNMEVNQTKSFPAANLSNVKVVASTKGFVLDRKYKCRMNKETKKVDVTRIK